MNLQGRECKKRDIKIKLYVYHQVQIIAFKHELLSMHNPHFKLRNCKYFFLSLFLVIYA